MWVLLDTPGILTPEQVSKISFYYQDRYRLGEIADRLDVTRFIVLGPEEKMTIKIKSDVIEALIAAIAISWQKAKGRGDWAVHKFVVSIYRQFFTIDPENYISMYGHPSERVNGLIQQLGINRQMLRELPAEFAGGNVTVIVTLDGNVIGTGVAHITTDVKADVAEDMARRAAYQDIISSGRLQSYARGSRSRPLAS